MRSFEILEILYRRLNFDVEQRGSALIVRKTIAGIISEIKFYPFRNGLLDDAAYEAADTIEQDKFRGTKVVISDTGFSGIQKEIFAVAKLELCNVTDWVNRILQSETICQSLKPRLTFGNEFVEPILEPVSYASLESWATATNADDGPLGNVVVLTGPAGFGKTALASRLASRCAEAHLQNPSLPVPLFVALEDFRAERRWDDLLSSFSRSMRMPEITPSALQYLIQTNRALLIVDGLDELAERGGTSAAADTLRQLTDNLNSGRLLVTARDIYLPRLKAALHVDRTTFVKIRGVRREARLNLLTNYSPRTVGIVSDILNDQRVSDSSLSTNPLFILVLAKALEAGADTSEWAKQPNAISLLSVALGQINSREVHRQDVGLSAEDYEELLGELALDAIKHGAASLAEDSLVVPGGLDFIQIWAEERLRLAGISIEEQRRKNNRILDSLRSHQAFAGKENELYFSHPFYRDALAAHRVLTKLRKNEPVFVTQALVDPEVTEYVVRNLAAEPEPAKYLPKDTSTDGTGFVVSAILQQELTKIDPDDPEPFKINANAILPKWKEINLAGVVFRNVKFEAIDFSGSDLTETVFRKCAFLHCNVKSAVLTNTQFEHCVSTEDTLNEIRSHGIVECPRVTEEATVNSTFKNAARDFAIDALQAFFRKFIKHVPGQHKRSVMRAAFSRGISADLSFFTNRLLLPIMLRRGVVDEVNNIDVLRFNPEFQQLGDSVVFGREVPNEFADLIHEIVDAAENYLG